MIEKNKFEYFLNAVHYCIWLFDMKFGDWIGKYVDIILSPIPKYFFTKNYREKCYEHRVKAQKEMDKFFYDKENGFHIGRANYLFGNIYSWYPGILSFILFGVVLRFFGNGNFLLSMLAIVIPIGLCYIPAYKAVFSKDRYLKYFKQFEKEDEQWHRKWKWTTVAFCIGSIVSGLLGMAAMWGVLVL
jgi:hypothetical protein